MPSRLLTHLVNYLKGVFCGFLVWLLLCLLHRYVFAVSFLRILRGPLLLLAPPVLYPAVLWVVLRCQLPPLPSTYIREKWHLWIPGFIVACLPSIDYLLLGKRFIRMVLG